MPELCDGTSSQPAPAKGDEEVGAAAVAVSASVSTIGSSERRSGKKGFIGTGLVSIVNRRSRGSCAEMMSGASTNQSTGVTKLWDQLTRPKNANSFMDEDDYDDEAEKKSRPLHSSCKFLWINCFTQLKVATRMNLHIVKAHPYIPIVAFLFFAALCAASIGTTFVLANNYKEGTKQVAYHYGIMGRQLLKDQMDTTLESLHALMHGIHDDPILRDLPFRLGAAGQPGSVPFLLNDEDVEDDKHAEETSHGEDFHDNEHAEESSYVRNVTGICDEPSLVADFAKTADVVRHAARLHGVVIHHATMLPYGVVCLSNPSLESSGYHLGQDLFKDLHHRAMVEKAISSTGALFSGPIRIPKDTHGGGLHGDAQNDGDDHHSAAEHDSDTHGNNHAMDEDELEHGSDHHSAGNGADEIDHHLGEDESGEMIRENFSHHEGGEEAEHQNNTYTIIDDASDHHSSENLDPHEGDAHEGHGGTLLDEGHGTDPVYGQEGEKEFYNIWLMHIPIDMPSSMGYAFNNHWGILEVSVDWDEFLRESSIRPFFKQHDGLGFAIKREDGNFLAMSKGAHDIDPRFFSWLKLDYRDTEEQWTLGVGVVDGYHPQWFGLGIGMSIFLSFFVSSLFLFSLVTWQGHSDFLLGILPNKAIQKVRRGEVYAERFDMVSIFFSDIVGYTKMSSEMRPNEVMKMLNDYFNEVDELSKKHQIYKIDTIGDAYMCAAGCPNRCMGPLGAQRIGLFALDMIELTNNFRLDDGSRLLIRCGINSGRVMAGVIGQIKPHFSLFGDTVNIAARMESTSENMKIQCSDTTYRLLRDAPDCNFNITQRGIVQVKGKGDMNTWFIHGATSRDTEQIILGLGKDSSTQSSD